MRIGVVIRRWRKMEERELREVAEQIGISPSTLARLEKGETPNGDTLAAAVRWLLSAEEPTTSAPGGQQAD